MDSNGFSRGLITSFTSSFILLNVFSIVSTICIEVFSKELDHTFVVLNLYGPYECKEIF